MSTILNKVSKQYLAYKAKKNKIKARHKQELIDLPKTELAYLGKEINEARLSGFKITEIMQVMGLKNRNFLYEALRAFHEVFDEKDDEAPESPEKGQPDKSEWSVDRLSANAVAVTVNAELYTLTVNERGVIVNMPDEWLEPETEQDRAVIKEIVKSVREAFA